MVKGVACANTGGQVSTPLLGNIDNRLNSCVSVRFAKPEEIGDFIAVMLSGKGFMTGSDMIIDGGYTIF